MGEAHPLEVSSREKEGFHLTGWCVPAVPDEDSSRAQAPASW